MTLDERIEFARKHHSGQVGFLIDEIDRLRAAAAEVGDGFDHYGGTHDFRRGYREGVREAEARTIERCAQVAETYPEHGSWNADGNFQYVAHGAIGKGQDSAARDIAAAIRALKDKP